MSDSEGEIVRDSPAPEIETFRCVVTEEFAGQRLDRFLARQSFLPTRSRIAALIREGLVTVNEVQRKAAFPVSIGEVVEVRVRPDPPPAIEAEAIPLTILHEDEAIIVVDKAAGMAAHPAPGCRFGTLVAALLSHWDMEGDWPDPRRPGIVHRLDKDTTGVMVVAKTPQALHALARQFEQRTVGKRYLALCFGAPAVVAGQIDLPIGRDPILRKQMQARHGQAREALTLYRTLQTFGGARPYASLIEATPRTGRTHQVRVHLASLGHPLVGDRVYGGGEAPAWSNGRAKRTLGAFERHALHASTLSFRHPLGGEPVEFEAALPSDMADTVSALGEFDRGPLGGRDGDT